jgi:hypothetical protein
LGGIAATLSAYFDAITARNYRLAWSNPYAGFAAGESTTTGSCTASQYDIGTASGAKTASRGSLTLIFHGG